MSEKETLMTFLGTFSAALLGLGLWGTVAFAEPFIFVFALMGLSALFLAVSELVDRPTIFDLGYRVSAFGGWVWLTVMIADVMNQGEPLLLPHAHIIALFGLASGAFMVSAFQSAGWINGPLLWGGADGQ